jgi:hypothetical protein
VPFLRLQHAEEVADGGALRMETERLREIAPGRGPIGSLERALRASEQLPERGILGRGGGEREEERGDSHDLAF